MLNPSVGWILLPPKQYIFAVLIPLSYLRRQPYFEIWYMVFLDDQIKMRSLGLALIWYKWHSYGKGNLNTDRHIEGKGSGDPWGECNLWRWRQTKWCICEWGIAQKPVNSGSQERGLEQFLPHSPQQEPILVTPATPKLLSKQPPAHQ
jgi:hypothetical protein